MALSLLFTAAAATGCTSDDGCSLNGVCDLASGSCKCDKPWGAADCSKLQFKPSPTTDCGKACAYHAMDAKNTSWGGSVLRHDGKYYMAAAEMANGCTLGQWQTNSQVALAVSDTPEGPYVKQAVPVPPWTHNPQVIRAADGTFLIFALGNGTLSPHGPVKQCAGAEAHARRALGPAPPPRDAEDTNQTVGFTIHFASSLAGPWRALNATIPNFRTADNMNNWNPAPVGLPDGRVRIMVHTDPAPWAGEVIVEAKDWRGPYRRITGDVMAYCSKCQEDPFMWVDKRGHWHALLHKARHT
jgi:hypothetical protein